VRCICRTRTRTHTHTNVYMTAVLFSGASLSFRYVGAQREGEAWQRANARALSAGLGENGEKTPAAHVVLLRASIGHGPIHKTHEREREADLVAIATKTVTTDCSLNLSLRPRKQAGRLTESAPLIFASLPLSRRRRSAPMCKDRPPSSGFSDTNRARGDRSDSRAPSCNVVRDDGVFGPHHPPPKFIFHFFDAFTIGRTTSFALCAL